MRYVPNMNTSQLVFLTNQKFQSNRHRKLAEIGLRENYCYAEVDVL